MVLERNDRCWRQQASAGSLPGAEGALRQKSKGSINRPSPEMQFLKKAKDNTKETCLSTASSQHGPLMRLDGRPDYNESSHEYTQTGHYHDYGPLRHVCIERENGDV